MNLPSLPAEGPLLHPRPVTRFKLCPEETGTSTFDSTLWLHTAFHSVTWLLIANGIGLLLATLLLVPALNHELGEWTYGRWMPLHLNLTLYGWCSLPWVGWLFRVYHAASSTHAPWARSALWAWSAALTAGALHWLSGGSSGKLFLDWQGYTRVLMALSMLFLWGVLTASFVRTASSLRRSQLRRAALGAGLIGLFAVPWALYWAAGPGVYPPVNPDTGGPTGASLLESTLGILFIILLIPHGLELESVKGRRAMRGAWVLLAIQGVLSVALGHGNNSHHKLSEILALSTLLLWVPLLPCYFKAFHWPSGVDSWKRACLRWWGLLVVSACAVFLPGILDHLKFTDGLVGHSHMAMAGFVSSLNLFLLSALLGRHSTVLNERWTILAWNIATLGHVLILFIAGWLEGSNPSFTMDPGIPRHLLYGMRWVCGALMLASSLHWWRQLRAACATVTECTNSACKDRFETAPSAATPSPSP